MNIYRRYFRVTEGSLVDAVKESVNVNEKAREQYSLLLSEIGAKKEYYQFNDKLVGILFDKEPDKYLYKKVKNGWLPKRNNKEAKAINEKFKAVNTVDINDCLNKVGLSNSPAMFDSGKCYYPVLIFIPSEPIVVFVSVPWYDESPDKLAEYKKEKEKGIHMDRNLDFLSWEPSEDMKTIKEWEYRKEIEEWNESIRRAE